MSTAESASPARRPFRIAAFPAGVAHWANPYFPAFHAALGQRGVSASDDLEIDLSWLKARSGALDAVHLHWPEYFWHRPGFSRLGRLGRAACAADRLLYLHRFLRAARRLGLLRIWTVHNIEPHEGAYRWDRYGYRLMAHECDLVICHSRSAVEDVRRVYRPRGRVVVMPIGHDAGVFPAPRARAQVLAELRLDPDRPVVSCLGRLRDYKGLDLACAAIDRLGGRVQLLVGGPRHSDFDIAPLRAAAARIPGVVLVDRQLSNQDLADYMAASDAALLSYRAITGSSALLTALGFGRGVVASELPYFQEILADEPDAGATVRGSDPGVWAEAIAEYLARPAAARESAALRLAARYSWDRCVEPLLAALGIPDGPAAAEARTAGAA